jgi:bifunctional non-homologous end joining protein LigD
MPFLQDRPAILQRYPRGIKAPMFFQQDLDSAPEFIKTARLTNQEGRQLDYGVYSTVASLLHFVNSGNDRTASVALNDQTLDKPDWIAIDLDPKRAPWENVLQVALVVKEVADEIGLQAFPKTSGSSGIHIYVPLKPTNEYDKVAEFARLFASEVARARRRSQRSSGRLRSERARRFTSTGCRTLEARAWRRYSLRAQSRRPRCRCR